MKARKQSTNKARIRERLRGPSRQDALASQAGSSRSSLEPASDRDHGVQTGSRATGHASRSAIGPATTASSDANDHPGEVNDPSSRFKDTQVYALWAAMQRDDADLFEPLQVALVSLISVGRSFKDHCKAEQEFNALEATLGGLEVVASISKSDGAIAKGDLRKLLHASGVVTLLIWDTLATRAYDISRDAPEFGEIENLLKLLTWLVDTFQFDERLSDRGHLRNVNQRSSSPISNAADSRALASIVNHNSNTTSVFGNGSLTNNNWAINVMQMAEQQRAIEKVTAALRERHVPRAVYDAQLNIGCMDKTRVRILSKIDDWIKDPDAKQICWITGMAGTGKTSVAKTTCERASEDTEIMLGGTFFCSRSSLLAAQRDIRCVIPTLAQLLALKSQEFCLALAEDIEPGFQYKEVAVQVKQLLYNPLLSLKQSRVPILFVIDALDECGGGKSDDMPDNTNSHQVVSAVLEALVNFSRATTKLPVKFLVTSRPEVQIRDTSISNDKLSYILQLQAVDANEGDADIRRPKIRAMITDSDVEHLVQLCGGLFIVAATVLEHTFGAGVAAAVSKFKKLLNPSRDALNATAAEPLNRMYEIILNDAAGKDSPGSTVQLSLSRLLALLLSARMTLSITAVADFLVTEPYEVTASLSYLHAVVHVPEDYDEPGLRTVHASFGDYLWDRAPDHIRIHRSLGHHILAHACLDAIGDHLRFDVSASSSSYLPNTKLKPSSLTLSLEYACLHWAHHVEAASKHHDGGPDITEYGNKINQKFRPKFLFWLEVLSVLDKVCLGVGLLRIAASAVHDSAALQFLRDANSFMASSHEAIERSAPHIYLSALPFAEKDSLVYQEFFKRCTGLIDVGTFGINHHGGGVVLTLKGHDRAVRSIAYSNDGRLASCSDDGTVRIWDIQTGDETMSPLRSGNGAVLSVAFASDNRSVVAGTEQGFVCIWNFLDGKASLRRLDGHSGRVNSVSYSRNGACIASASADKTVRLWRVEIAEQIAVLNGHTAEVCAVAWSTDGAILASGSEDKSIRLWQLATCEPAGRPMYGHQNHVFSICFSVDDSRLASSAADLSIKLWDTHTGVNIATLHGHTNIIRCVQFSPDGKSLVSASDDCSVRLWTLSNNTVEASSTVFNGHMGLVRSASFSPDGLYFASASNDRTICIWDAENGQKAIHPLPAHDKKICSVAVSANGDFIVSGSEDRSVRVWDAHTGEPHLAPLLGHTDSVYAVTISFNGNRIASASGDHTVRLWNALNGDLIGEPLRGHVGWVRALAFSPDSQWLASGSDDRTVRVWNSETGQSSNFGPLRRAGGVHTVAYSPDGRLLVAGDKTGRIRLWHADSGRPVGKPVQTSSGNIVSIDISPDSNLIVFCANTENVHVRDVSTRRQLLVLRDPRLWLRSVSTSAKFSPGGQFICSGSVDKAVRIWDASNGGLIATLCGHTGSVRSVAFNPDMQSIVSCSDDKTIRTWSINAARFTSVRSVVDPVIQLASAKLENEWLVGSSGELLLWVPAEYRRCLQILPCTMVIGQYRIAVVTGGSGWHRGVSWNSCWHEAPRAVTYQVM